MRKFLSQTAHLNRAIISDDFEKTLGIIKKRVPIKILKYPTGSHCFDWIIPKKWIIRDAYIKDSNGKRILDWKKTPLHVVIGSLSIKKKITKKELLKKIYVSDDLPNEIPYHFQYYELDWGFSMAKKDLSKLKGDWFDIEIDSEYVDGNLTMGEATIKGASSKCIVLMAHIDHPAQVNDGLAGAAVLIKLFEFLKARPQAYTLKFHFLPERIGSIAYLANHKKDLRNILGGIFCEMPGTKGYPLALQYSKYKDTRMDRVARYVVKRSDKRSLFCDCYLHIVNDDGFYNSSGIDIPCISLSRSRALKDNNFYHCPGYHTSKDNLRNFDFKQTERYLGALKEIIAILNADRKIIRNYNGIPNLSRHNLWVDWRVDKVVSQNLENILNSIENNVSIFDIADHLQIDFYEVASFMKKMAKCGLVKLTSTESIWFGNMKPGNFKLTNN